MEKSTKEVALLLVLACLCLKEGHSELITHAQDTEALVNQSTYFSCSSSNRNEQIHWYHYRVGDNKTNYVYYKGQFNKIYANRYSIQINIDTGENNLIIRSVQPEDAGRYVCQDEGGLGRKSSAELIVLETRPTCQSNMKPNGLVGPNSCGLRSDELQLSCSVSYSGNIPPIMQWKMDGEDTPILKGTTMDNSGKRVTMNLTMSSDVKMDNVSFTCGTTRSRGEHSSCSVGPVKVNYALEYPLILNKTKGETITCSANSSVSCQYRWFYGNDSLCPVSCNQVLTTIQLEDHYCEATCTINGISCTFVAIRIFVFQNETTTASTDTTKTLLLAILIPSVVLLLIIICILFFIIRKVKTSNKKLTEENVQMHQTLIKSGILMNAPEEAKTEFTRPHEMPAVEKKPLLPGNDDEDQMGIRNRNIQSKQITTTKTVAFQPLNRDDTNITKTGNKQEIITKASKDEGRAVAGVAILDDLIYVVSERSSKVEAFNTKTLEFKNRWSLEELDDPWDLVSCVLNKCLYIMSRKFSTKTDRNQVLHIDSDAKVLARLSTGEEYGSLSITSDGNLVVTVCDSSRLFIYTPDGNRSAVSLSDDTIHPSHAIKLSNGHILLTHGFGDDSVHRVCTIDESGEILSNSFEPMDTPSYLAVSKNGLVVVADLGNSRICVLNSDLEIVKEIASKKDGLRSPQRICLDEKTDKLFVADNEFTEFKRRNGKVVVFNVDLWSE